MFRNLTGDQWLGLCAALFSALLLFVWIPLDVDTGLVEKVRRQVTLGDSLGPTVAGVVILLGGVLTLFNPDHDAPHLEAKNLRWLALLLVSLGVGLVVMRYAGPLIAGFLTEQSYRSLRATPPWNYSGFILGGTILVALLISVVRGRASLSAVLAGLVASLVIALLYDVPFDDLQLPPNGDV